MVVFSIGLPSRFAAWCDTLVRRLVESCVGSVDSVALNTLEELASAVIRTPAPNLVVCSRQPVTRLQSELVHAGRPFLVALGDPRAALRQMVDSGGVALLDAVRAVASSCAAMGPLISAPNALVLSRNEAADPAALARRIASHLDIDAASADLGDLAVIQAGAETAAPTELDAGWQDGLSEREQTVIDGALRPYVTPLTEGAALDLLIWERELFFLYEDPPAALPVPAIRPVDITGRARIVIYGPGINLPPGGWSANLTLAFSAETSGMSFLVEIYAGRQLAQTRIESSGAQVLVLNIDFVIDDMLDSPIEVRVLSLRAAFDGRLALGQVKLTRLASGGGEIQDYLSQILQA